MPLAKRSTFRTQAATPVVLSLEHLEDRLPPGMILGVPGTPFAAFALGGVSRNVQILPPPYHNQSNERLASLLTEEADASWVVAPHLLEIGDTAVGGPHTHWAWDAEPLASFRMMDFSTSGEITRDLTATLNRAQALPVESHDLASGQATFPAMSPGSSIGRGLESETPQVSRDAAAAIENLLVLVNAGHFGNGGGGIQSENQPPDAVDDYDSHTTATEDTPLTINVLANDTDPDNDPLAVTAVTQGTNGAVVRNANNTVTYTPSSDWIGQDTFTYTISDGRGGTDTATVTMTVVWVNDAPIAMNDVVTTSEENGLSINVLANDSDVDGDTLRITDVLQPANGIAEVLENSWITYTPNANFTGVDTFTYTIWDGYEGEATATVSVTVTAVNDVPQSFDNAYRYFTRRDTNPPRSTSYGLLDNDIDYDLRDVGYNPSLLQVGAVESSATPGTLNVFPNGSFEYTPQLNWFGVTSFTYRATDGIALGNWATVWLFVNEIVDGEPIEPPPLEAVEDQYVIHSDGYSGNVLANDVGATRAILVTPPEIGNLTFSASGAYSYQPLPHTSAEGAGYLGGLLSDTLVYEAWSSDGRMVQASMQKVGSALLMQARSHDFKAPQTAGTWATAFSYPRNVARIANFAPRRYVHFNVDNDNLNTPDGRKWGDPGFNPNLPSVADYTELAYVANENDLKELKLTVNPLPNTGSVTLERSDNKIRVWRHGTKGGQGQPIGDAMVLVNDNTRSWNLANAAERADFLTFATTPLWVEGYGSEKEHQGWIKLTVNTGMANLSYMAQVNYHFFAAVAGRQPTPAERSFIKLNYPNIVHGEWSITGEQSPAYNCIAWSLSRNNVLYNRVRAEGHVPDAVIAIDVSYGNNNNIWEQSDIDAFYLNLANGQLRPIQNPDASAPKQAKVMYWVSFHAAKNLNDALANGNLIMYESKLGREWRIQHVWNQLNGGFYGDPKLYYK